MLSKLKVDEFVAEVASNSPAPGGGSVAALSASLGAGLISMLANLTKDKKGYEDYHGEMAKVASRAQNKSEEFLAIIDKDTKAFEVYMDAIKMPKDTDEQKAARQKAMQAAAEGATNVPLSLARDAFTLIKDAEYVTRYGNKNATSDGAVALLMLRSGILGAIYNVRINLGSIKNESFVSQVTAEVDKIEKRTKQIESEILSAVTL